MVPGIEEYVAEFTSDKAWGDEGYLVDKGLIPLSVADRKRIHDGAMALQNLSM